MQRFSPIALPSNAGPNDAVIGQNFRLMAQALNSLQRELLLFGGGGGSASASHGSGTPGILPVWDTSTTLSDSVISQSGSAVSISGSLTVTDLADSATTRFVRADAFGNLLADLELIEDANILSVSWSKITSTPTTLSGYGITDAQPLDADLTAIAALATTGYARRSGTNTWVLDSTIPWSSISGTPTTISGYGITDAVDGSGAANRVAYWSDANTLTSDAGLAYNGSTDVLSLSGRLNINGATDSSSFGLNISGRAAATSGGFSFSSFGVGVPGGTNTELIRMYHDGNVGLLEVLASGTGTVRPLRFTVGGTTRYEISAAGAHSITGPVTMSSTLGLTGSLISGSNSTLYRDVATSFAGISGGASRDLGGNLLLYGESHATLPNRIEFRQGTTGRYVIDGSGNHTLTGTVSTSSTLTVNGQLRTDGTGDIMRSNGSGLKTWRIDNGDLRIWSGDGASQIIHFNSVTGGVTINNLSGTGTRLVTATSAGLLGSAATIGNAYISDLSWSKITSTPTTLSGYGITDAVPSSRTITAGVGLSGGGALSSDVTLSIPPGGIVDSLVNDVAWGKITGVPGSFSGFANPTASIGLSAVNGSATTAMRSDAAPALSQAIVPTWTGLHTFSGGLALTGGTFGAGRLYINSVDGLSMGARTGSSYDFSLLSSTGSSYLIRVPTGTNNIHMPSGTVGISGNTSIGKLSAPTARLDVNGDVNIGSTSTTAHYDRNVRIYGAASSGIRIDSSLASGFVTANDSSLYFGIGTANDVPIYIFVNNSTVGVINYLNTVTGVFAFSGQIRAQTGLTSLTTLYSDGSFGASVLTRTSNLTLSAAHHTVIFTGSSNTTFTLPLAADCSGRIYVINYRGTAGAVLTIQASGSDDIWLGATSTASIALEAATNTSGDSIWGWTLQSDGTAWNVIANLVF